MNSSFIGLRDLPKRYPLHYFTISKSPFRMYQDLFLEKYGKHLNGHVVELGGETSYNHKRFFPNASSFTCTNIARDFEEFLDITDMSFATGSQDAFVCISVLEHVNDIMGAFREIRRTLKVGGQVLLVVPFAYPIHDTVDYWRLAPDAYREQLDGFAIEELVHLGGTFSNLSSVLQRPKGKLTKRYFVYKMLGLGIYLSGLLLEIKDGFPLGCGIVARKLS